MASKLNYQIDSAPAVQVKVADGSCMTSSNIIKDLPWCTQGQTFISTVRLLNIPCYDMILWVDWLEEHSPMWINWKKKLLRFSHKGQRITLKCVKDNTSNFFKLRVRKLRGLIKQGGVAHLIQLSPVQQQMTDQEVPAPIQQVIDKYTSLFQEPTELPPSRHTDHAIILLLGVKPVNVKPYRYSPSQKVEIERQVKDMLTKGLIQSSTSPFSSPVLLVKKKDGT